MKKRICTLLVFLILLVSIIPTAANAATPRALCIAPALSFTGTTANCEVTISTDYLTSKISATIKLWDGSTCIATWTCSDTGVLYFSDTKGVTKGKAYTLTVDATINGVQQSQVSITRTCS